MRSAQWPGVMQTGLECVITSAMDPAETVDERPELVM